MARLNILKIGPLAFGLRTHEGAPARHISPELQLRRSVLACMLWESQFYEDGVEIAVPADAAAALWRAITGAGITPAGLGARDTLRLEAALPLHGHELGPGITPLQAGLGWVVRWDKPGGFRGQAALEAGARAAGDRRRGAPATP